MFFVLFSFDRKQILGMDRKHREELFSPNCNALDFFSQANQSESLMFEKLALERAKRGGEIYNMAITRILEEEKKGSKGKNGFPNSLFKNMNLS